MTLDLPRLSPHLRQRAQEETRRVLRRVGRMRIDEIEPFLIDRSSSPRIAVHIDLKISRRETLRGLSMRIADPKEPDLLRQVIVSVFRNRKEDAVAIESHVYISFTTELLARRYPNGRPYYTAEDATLERLLRPDLSALNLGRRLAGQKDPDATLRRYFEVLHAWHEAEHRRGESNHGRMDRLKAQAGLERTLSTRMGNASQGSKR